MASFSKWADTPGTRRYYRLRGSPSYPVTYQDWADDAGNYNSFQVGVGPLIGSNRSISAPLLSAWRKHQVTKEEMMNLGLEEAKEITKVMVWDKIYGDKIESQIVAEFIADLKSSTGNVKILQRALNELGAGLSVDGGMGPKTLEALNKALDRKGEKAVYDAMRKSALDFFAAMSNRKYGEAQVKHLDKDYPIYENLSEDRKKKASSKKWLWVVALIAVLLIAWALYYYRGRFAALLALLIVIPFIPPF